MRICSAASVKRATKRCKALWTFFELNVVLASRMVSISSIKCNTSSRRLSYVPETFWRFLRGIRCRDRRYKQCTSSHRRALSRRTQQLSIPRSPTQKYVSPHPRRRTKAFTSEIATPTSISTRSHFVPTSILPIMPCLLFNCMSAFSSLESATDAP